MQPVSKTALAMFSSLVLAGYLGTTFALAQAQPDAQSAPEARAAAAASGAEAPLTVQYESHLTIRDDLSATELTTKRLRVNAPVAIQAVGQQRLPYIEGMHVLEVVEAFTEKPDGRRIAVAPSNIITQDVRDGFRLVATNARSLAGSVATTRAAPLRRPDWTVSCRHESMTWKFVSSRPSFDTKNPVPRLCRLGLFVSRGRTGGRVRLSSLRS